MVEKLSMNIEIHENGCQDKEVKLLDTRLPYFYAEVQKLFIQEPSKIHIVFLKSKEEFLNISGQDSEECAFTKEDTIYIYEPHLFGKITKIPRCNFYQALYQELVYLFYKTSKTVSFN